MSEVERVRRYYDRNTRRFLRFGHGRAAAAIHRAVWGPGVSDRPTAMNYVNNLVLNELQNAGSQSVLDLGCGVGGTIAYLSTRHRATYTGLTLSPVQARIGEDLLTHAGDSRSELSIHAGDFHRRGDLGGPYDAVYAIESLLHANDVAAVVANIATATTTGAILAVCDDFLSDEPAEAVGRRRERMIERFTGGWHAPGLTRHSRFVSLCREVGFDTVSDTDLSPYLELGRPRDLAIRGLMSVFGWLPFSAPVWTNMRGGDALQTCLRAGWIEYRFSLFRRR